MGHFTAFKKLLQSTCKSYQSQTTSHALQCLVWQLSRDHCSHLRFKGAVDVNMKNEVASVEIVIF